MGELFKPTEVQKKALELLKSSAKHVLLFGGSRSGKTTVLVMAIIYRAIAYPGSRHLICRYRAKDARSSVLHETLIPWLNKTIGAKNYHPNVHDGVITLWNKSEIWIGGLGDREQVDKILGHEYVTIYFNEVSQISYSAITTAYSRLAMKVEGCKNKFFYDCNPCSPMHWAYKVFIRKIEPRTDEALNKPELYASAVLNPADNAENLDADYISDILDNMPEKQKARFRDGLWVKPEGSVYERFDESMIVDELPEKFDRQCLVAKADPFTGAMNAEKAKVVPIKSTDESKLSYLDFREAELKIPAEERKNCMWFMNETVLNYVANIKDDNGNPIWRKPCDAMPGRIDGYEVHESTLLPQLTELGADKPIAIFMNPKKIVHGNRKGIEIKRYDDTTENLEYGESFIRFRKRDGFLVTRAAANIGILKTAKQVLKKKSLKTLLSNTEEN
ncbi:MAG: phage major capsid protein [Treponema sp.]|nr:phage major capsid protein [Treponema sp.]